jgi:hypothetical protein
MVLTQWHAASPDFSSPFIVRRRKSQAGKAAEATPRRTE